MVLVRAGDLWELAHGEVTLAPAIAPRHVMLIRWKTTASSP